MNQKMRCSQCKQRHIDFSDTIKLDKDGNPYNNACPISISMETMQSKLRRKINKIIARCLNTLKRKEGN